MRKFFLKKKKTERSRYLKWTCKKSTNIFRSSFLQKSFIHRSDILPFTISKINRKLFSPWHRKLHLHPKKLDSLQGRPKSQYAHSEHTQNTNVQSLVLLPVSVCSDIFAERLFLNSLANRFVAICRDVPPSSLDIHISILKMKSFLETYLTKKSDI